MLCMCIRPPNVNRVSILPDIEGQAEPLLIMHYPEGFAFLSHLGRVLRCFFCGHEAVHKAQDPIDDFDRHTEIQTRLQRLPYPFHLLRRDRGGRDYFSVLRHLGVYQKEGHYSHRAFLVVVFQLSFGQPVLIDVGKRNRVAQLESGGSDVLMAGSTSV